MDGALESLTGALRRFAAQRDWDQFHSPKNLAAALTVEAAELLEHFQWLTEEQSRNLAPDKQIADKLQIDLVAAAEQKLELNASKYPAAQVRGTSRKYSEL